MPKLIADNISYQKGKKKKDAMRCIQIQDQPFRAVAYCTNMQSLVFALHMLNDCLDMPTVFRQALNVL